MNEQIRLMSVPDALIVYPKCKAGFHAVGCCVCSPDCPSGLIDSGATCTKNTIPRGVGTLPTCSANLEYDMGLCYQRAKAGYTGVGPVAWDNCPASTPVNAAPVAPMDRFQFRQRPSPRPDSSSTNLRSSQYATRAVRCGSQLTSFSAHERAHHGGRPEHPGENTGVGSTTDRRIARRGGTSCISPYRTYARSCNDGRS